MTAARPQHDPGRRAEDPGDDRRRRRAWRLLAALATAACAGSRAPAPPAQAGGAGYVEQGFASWYGEPYHGRPTASGAGYDMREMTAAHRTLPFGTIVRVRNAANGREVSVLINDRGPFVEGRIIDLSWAAAKRLDAIGPGVVPVRLEVERIGDGMTGGRCWEVQVGAFAKRENVERAMRDLAAKGLATRLAPAGGGLTRVRVVGLPNFAEATEMAAALDAAYPGTTPVPCEAGR